MLTRMNPIEQSLLTDLGELLSQQQKQHGMLAGARSGRRPAQLSRGLRRQRAIGLRLFEPTVGLPARRPADRKPANAGLAGAGGHGHGPLPGCLPHAAQGRTVPAGRGRALRLGRASAVQERSARLVHRHVRRRQRRGPHDPRAGHRPPVATGKPLRIITCQSQPPAGDGM